MGRNLHNIAIGLLLTMGTTLGAPAAHARGVSGAAVSEIKIVQASFRAGSYIQASFSVTNGDTIKFFNDFIVSANVASNLYTVKTENGYAHWQLKNGIDPRTVGTITFPLTIRLPYDREKTTFCVRAWGINGKLAPSSPRTIYIERASTEVRGNNGHSQGYVELQARGNQEINPSPSGASMTYYGASTNLFFPLKPGIFFKAGVQNTGTKDQSYNPMSPAEQGETVNTVSLGVRVDSGRSGVFDIGAGWNALPDWKSHKNSWQLQLGYRRSMWTPERLGGELQLTSNALNDLGVYGSFDVWPGFVGQVPIGVSLIHVTKWNFGYGSEGITGAALKARQQWIPQLDAEGTLGVMVKTNKTDNSYSPTLQGGVSVRF